MRSIVMLLCSTIILNACAKEYPLLPPPAPLPTSQNKLGDMAPEAVLDANAVSKNALALRQALHLVIDVQGNYTGNFRDLMVQYVTNQGYVLADNQKPTKLRVAVVLTYDDLTGITSVANNTYLVRGSAQITLQDVVNNKTIAVLHDSRKEAGRSMVEAQRRIVQYLAKKLSVEVVEKINMTIQPF